MLNVNNYHSQSGIAGFENMPASTASVNICSQKRFAAAVISFWSETLLQEHWPSQALQFPILNCLLRCCDLGMQHERSRDKKETVVQATH